MMQANRLNELRLIDKAAEKVDVSGLGLNSAGTAMVLNDDALPLTVDGDLTLTGAVSIDGALAVTGLITGQRRAVSIESSSVAEITAAESGKVFICTKGSGTQTMPLPAASTAGLQFTFICGDPAGEILVNVQSGDNIVLKASEGGAAVTTASSTGCKNTAATNVKGDRITLISDGTTTWYAIEQSGIWATQ